MTEAAFLDELFARARRAMDAAANSKVAFPPRFVVEGGRCMARHLGMDDDRLQQLLPEAAFYQWFLPAALGADQANFAQAASRLPDSYQMVRARLVELEAQHPQMAYVSFHMSGLALAPMLMAPVVAELHPGPRHVMIAPRNLSWLTAESSQWVRDTAELIPTDGAGLRRLIAGLRDGSIERLGTLVDGPHPPGRPGTRALTGVSPTLGFRTGVLRTILTLGIPVIALAHWWEADRLQLRFSPLMTSPEEGIDTITGMIEDLLRRHPEQWLNWPAARLRT